MLIEVLSDASLKLGSLTVPTRDWSREKNIIHFKEMIFCMYCGMLFISSKFAINQGLSKSTATLVIVEINLL